MSRPSSFTFEQAFERYMRCHAVPYLKTAKELSGLYRRYLKAPLGKRRLSSISRFELQELHARIGATAGKTSANRALELVRTIYNRMWDWGLYAGTNPACRLHRFRLKSRERFILPHEMPAFLAALDALKNKTAKDVFLVALYTGARKSDVLSMRWSDVDFEQAIWHIPSSKTTPYDAPLLPEVVTLLEARRDGGNKPGEFITPTSDGFVFEGRAGAAHFKNPYPAWRQLRSLSGLHDLRIHDLRRTLGSWQAMTGASLSVIGKTLNHSDPASTAIYARLTLEPVRKALVAACGAMRQHI